MINKCSKCSLAINSSRVVTSVVATPLTTITSSVNNVNASQRAFTIVLLDNSTLDIVIDVKSSVGDLFQRACELLQLKEYDIFALATKTRNEYHFLASDEKLSKLISSTKRQVNQSGNSQFFVQNPVFTGLGAANITPTPSPFFFKTSSNVATPAFVYLPNTAKLAMVNPVYELSNEIDSSTPGATNSQMVTSTTSHSSSQSSSSSIPFFNLFSKSSSANSTANKNQFCSCPVPLTEAASTPHSNLTFYFRVKFYVSDPLLLRNPQTRYLYYLQLRQNYLNLYYMMSEENYFMLASLAIVADFGPFNPSIHFGKYFDLNLYFPSWIISKLGEDFIYSNMPQLHANRVNMSANSAQTKFCTELSKEDGYPFNLHIYNVYKNKEETPGTMCLGIAPNGIFVFELRDLQELSLITTFPWSSISKLITEKKKFEIRNKMDSKVGRYTYYTRSDKFPKYLLELSKLTHSFTINIFARLADQKTLANYMSEAYSEKVLSISEAPAESFQEREINSISMIETDDIVMQESETDQLPRVTGVQQLIDETTSADTRRSELETIEEEEPAQPASSGVKPPENLSSSFTSTSSSYYETALGLNNNNQHNESYALMANYSNNSEDFALQDPRNISVIQIGSNSSLTSPSLASNQAPDSLSTSSLAKSVSNVSSSELTKESIEQQQQENLFAPAQHDTNQALSQQKPPAASYSHLYQQNPSQPKYNLPYYSNFKKSNFVDTTDYSRENQILLSHTTANLDSLQLNNLQQQQQLSQLSSQSSLDFYQHMAQHDQYPLMAPGSGANSSALAYRQTFSAGNDRNGLARSSSLKQSNLISSASMPPLSPFPPPIPSIPPPPVPTMQAQKQPLQATRSNEYALGLRYDQNYYGNLSGQQTSRPLLTTSDHHQFANMTFANIGNLINSGHSHHPGSSSNTSLTMPATLTSHSHLANSHKHSSNDHENLHAFKHLKSQMSPPSTSSSSSSLYLLFRNSSNMGSNTSINPGASMSSSQANSSPTSLFYHKHKDPPSYEESVKRIKSHSNQSSSSFDDNDSNASKSTSSFRNDSSHSHHHPALHGDPYQRHSRNTYLFGGGAMNEQSMSQLHHQNSFESGNLSMKGYFDHNNNSNAKNTQQQNDKVVIVDDDEDIEERRSIKFSNGDDDTDDEVITDDDDFVRTDDDDDLMDANLLSRTNTLINTTTSTTDNKANEISLSIENLEQIRNKAESMSLPLLTALCNDSSVLRCLSHSNSNRVSKPDEKV